MPSRTNRRNRTKSQPVRRLPEVQQEGSHERTEVAAVVRPDDPFKELTEIAEKHTVGEAVEVTPITTDSGEQEAPAREESQAGHVARRLIQPYMIAIEQDGPMSSVYNRDIYREARELVSLEQMNYQLQLLEEIADGVGFLARTAALMLSDDYEGRN